MTGDAATDYDEKAAARILGLAPRTLRRWRKAGLIGHYLTPTGRVRYSVDDLLAVQMGGRVAKSGSVSANGRACPQLAACVPSTGDTDAATIRA